MFDTQPPPPRHTPAQFGTKPYARIRICNTGDELYVPLHWFHRVQLARRATPKEVLNCFYSADLAETPNFRLRIWQHGFAPGYGRQYAVNVLEIFEGRPVDEPSDDDSLNDNASLLSLDPANGSGGGAVDESADDVLTSAERGEEKLLQALENATEKSVQTRTAALAAIAEVLAHRYMPDCVDDRKMTIMDLIERSLRKGKGAEQALAAQLVPILVLQLGDAELVGRALGALLLQTAQNPAAAAAARAKCCTALGLVGVLGGSDVGDALQTMQAMETLFAGAYLKGDKSQSGATTEASVLHCAALGAWSLLLTLCPAGDFCSLMNNGSQGVPSIKNLIGLLHSQHLDVRMAAGETIALILETGRTHDADFLDEHLGELVDVTRQLATDSQKFRAKRDRKTQRATFRDVLRFVEADQLPETQVRFGCEKLELDSWAEHALYAALVGAMGPGMTTHLAENDFLRDVLELGPQAVEPQGWDLRRTRQQRHLMNAAAFKERTRLRTNDRKKKGHF